MRVSRSRTAAVAALLVLLSSCRGGVADEEPTGGVPLTQRAVAAVAAEHLRVVPASARSTDARLGDPPGEVGAELGLPADGSGAGSVVRVVVSPEPGARTCRGREDESGCAVAPTDGGVVRLTWDLLTPEEDPGYVAVSMVRDDGSTTVSLTGPPIARDPRLADLSFSVEDLVALAEDPRLRLTTTAEAAALGDRLATWEGGVPDPRGLERVRTDPAVLTDVWARSVAAAGGPAPRVRGWAPSPLVAGRPGWSARTVSARVTLDPQARAPYTVVDLVVTRGSVPGRPEGDTCDVVPPARCADPFLGAGRYVVEWVPGPAGRVEVLLRRGPDTVLVRLAGWRVPVGYDAVVAQTSWVGLTAVMADRQRFAPTTPRRVAERSET